LAEKIKELVQTEAYGLYHITNSGECSWYEFAAKVFEFLGLKPNFGPTTTVEYGARARRPAYSVLAQEKLKRLGLSDMRTWPEALAEYLREVGHEPFG